MSEADPQTPAPTPRDAPIGGQAVLEGVMMRGVSTWAVAVRKPSPEQLADGHQLDPTEAALGEIEVVSEPLVSWVKRHRVLRLPLIRGVAALGESLKIGFKALGISANAQIEADEDGEKQEIGGGTWAGTVIFSVLLAIGLFFLLPVGITSLLKGWLPGALVFVLVEKAIRISIFLGYLWLISRMKDLQRVFEYHGAEHKTISCYEAGPAAHAGERPAVLAPPSPLRHELPADRDGGGDLRVRAARHAGLVHPVRVARGRHPAGGRHRVRGDQAVRQAPRQALGPDPDVARACSSSGSPPARPTSPSSPWRLRRSRRCSRWRTRSRRPKRIGWGWKSSPESKVDRARAEPTANSTPSLPLDSAA